MNLRTKWEVSKHVTRPKLTCVVHHHVHLGVHARQQGALCRDALQLKGKLLLACLGKSSSPLGLLHRLLLGGHSCAAVVGLRRLLLHSALRLSILQNLDVALFLPPGPVRRVAGTLQLFFSLNLLALFIYNLFGLRKLVDKFKSDLGLEFGQSLILLPGLFILAVYGSF